MQKIFSINADINIIIAIIININNTYPCCPYIGSEACFFSDVFKFIIAFIDVESGSSPGCR